ncbi:MAG: YfhO family protein, partial [Ferruginibacter sp.]|nr:YfhO family protein [Ferruginibacter sp.]
LMAYQLSGNLNDGVLNMLNAKYILYENKQGDNVAERNPNALGNAWFVNNVSFVKGAAEEMKSLFHFNSKDSAHISPTEIAYVDEQYKSAVGSFVTRDSNSIITMNSFDNDAITYKSKTAVNQIVVFSEIYYKDWKAYIDGKPADYFKANYVLRGMNIPSGEHTIEFKFEPKAFFIGDKIGRICSWITALLLVALLARIFLKKNKHTLT